MAKFLTVLSLILAAVLFPPAVLAVVSNNAVPGDFTYPVKRGLEDVIFAIASINPTSKAWFAAARSTRRFKETVILVDKNISTVSQSLDELVIQTEIAAKEIEQVKNLSQKEKLKKQLVESINGYNQKLTEIKSKVESQQAPSPPPVATNPTPAPAREVGPTPSPQPATPVPQVPPDNTGSGLAGEISDAQNRLGDIEDRLQLESQDQDDQKDNQKQDEGQEESSAGNQDKNHTKSSNQESEDKKEEKGKKDEDKSNKEKESKQK